MTTLQQPYYRADIILAETGMSQNNVLLTEAGIVALWEKLPPIPGKMIPLVRSDGREIGWLKNFTFSAGEGRRTCIFAEAFVTDTDILHSPGINPDQVVRAAIRFMAGC